MKRLVLLAGAALAVTGCFGGGPKEIPPLEAKFVTNDCALIGAVGRDHYKFTRDDPPRRAMMVGEDLPWHPTCDYQSMGMNLVEVTGPEGVAATANMAQVSFHRPKYDKDGAEIRTSLESAPGTSVRTLCRLAREGNDWSVDTCGPDPKETQPRPPPPSPADVTPDSKLPVPVPGDRAPTARELNTQADPGGPPTTP